MSAIETEVKFRVHDAESWNSGSAGGGFLAGNSAYLRAQYCSMTLRSRRLRLDRQILRIREYGEKWVLTHKAIPARVTPGSTSNASKPKRRSATAKPWPLSSPRSDSPRLHL
jgi:adenylate cyclase class 2